MKMIIRAITYFYFKLRCKKGASTPYVFEREKKPNFFFRVFESIGGFFYFSFQKFTERFRIWRYKQTKQKQEEGVLFEIVKHSKELLFNLFLVIVLFTLFDYGFYFLTDRFGFQLANFINLLPSDFIELILGISIGAISAILGLIFALYAVGFQITTEKYSSKVSDYINQEMVGNFFFKLLVFTDLLALFTLLRIKFINIYPYFSFPVVIVCVSISFLGILIFKNHYVVSLKPKVIFERLWGDLKEKINLASQRQKKTFKSWSIVQDARDKSQEFLNLMEFLFDDLLRAKNWNDIIYAPIVLANIFSEYVDKKKYIDKDRTWWFPQYYKQVKSDNTTSLSIKLNYEIQGKGPLHIQAPNFNWFEDRTYELFQHMVSKINLIRERDNFIINLIKGYQIILTGEYVRDRKGRYIKETLGAYENQEIVIFEKFFAGFKELVDKIDLKNDSIITAYMNTYFAIGLAVMEGFDYKRYREIIKNLVNDKLNLSLTRGELENKELPAIFYEKVLDYYDRLEIEQYCEGSIKTPKSWLIQEIISESQTEEKNLFEKYFKQLIEHQNIIIDRLYEDKQYKYLALFLKMRLEWFSRLLYIGKADLAEEQSERIAEKIIYILDIPKNILIETEFLEGIEKLLFPTILESKFSLFGKLLKPLMLSLTILNSNETDIDRLVERNRITLIIGGFIYLTSEFKQDKKFLLEYVRNLEKIFRSGFFTYILELMANPKKLGGLNLTIKLIHSETTKYHHWFSQVLQKINDLPKTYDDVRFYSGLQEVADHPSKFIREISYGLSFYEEECINAFVEWVKKREEIKKLIRLLNQIKDGQ